jgi:hypothetical protein
VFKKGYINIEIKVKLDPDRFAVRKEDEKATYPPGAWACQGNFDNCHCHFDDFKELETFPRLTNVQEKRL